MTLSFFFNRPVEDLIEPFREHMRRVTECAHSIPVALRACGSGDTQSLGRIHKTIQELEKDSGILTVGILRNSRGKIYAGVPRHSLLDVLRIQHDIVSRCEDITDLLYEFPGPIPEELALPLSQLAVKGAETISAAGSVLCLMLQVHESSPPPREVELARLRATEVHAISGETRTAGSALQAVLWGLRDGLDALSAVLLLDLVNWVGDLADYGGKLASHSQNLVAS